MSNDTKKYENMRDSELLGNTHTMLDEHAIKLKYILLNFSKEYITHYTFINKINIKYTPDNPDITKKYYIHKNWYMFVEDYKENWLEINKQIIKCITLFNREHRGIPHPITGDCENEDEIDPYTLMIKTNHSKCNI